jgi:hypothetical protein
MESVWWLERRANGEHRRQAKLAPIPEDAAPNRTPEVRLLRLRLIWRWCLVFWL